uniref:(northern house mosquito) hypothetical protein n=1 Tax=Culex pipiens TaxID=7175 RepID=A0A8D8AD37_CULPI
MTARGRGCFYFVSFLISSLVSIGWSWPRHTRVPVRAWTIYFELRGRERETNTPPGGMTTNPESSLLKLRTFPHSLAGDFTHSHTPSKVGKNFHSTFSTG